MFTEIVTTIIFLDQGRVAAKGKQVYLIWKLIFVRSNGAMNVFAVAPASAPEVKCMKIFDLFSFLVPLCNLSPKNKDA